MVHITLCLEELLPFVLEINMKMSCSSSKMIVIIPWQLHTCIIKIVTFNVGKVIFPYHKELLLKERIHSPWEQFPLREVPILKRDALLKRITA